MIPSMENLFKRGADLYYSRRHSYPLFKIEFRPGIDGEWIYEITIKGDNGKVAQLRYTKFDDNIIVSMIESLLNSEDIANIELTCGLYRNFDGMNTITIERPTIIDFNPEEEV